MTAEPCLYAAMGEQARPLVSAAARQLSAAVGTVLGRPWPVAVDPSEPAGTAPAGAILIASLIEDVMRKEPIETTTRRWQERIERWSHRGISRILLCTLFRNVSGPVKGEVDIERLRRLDMMALYLSRNEGIEIVDVDRLFAWCGARTLGTDYRCLGPRAAELGGHAMVATIFAGSLDDFLPADVQDAAARQHGGSQDLAAIMQRRIYEP